MDDRYGAGRRLRVGLRLAAALAACMLAPGPSGLAQDLPPVARYEAWRGGAAFRKLAGFHAVGRLSTGGLSGTIDIASESDGRSRQRIDLGVFKQDNVLGGDAGWSTTLGGTAGELSAAEVADAARENALLYDGVLHGHGGALLGPRPRETLEATVCDVIRVSYPGSPSTYDYLVSASDGRLLAIRSHVAGATRLTAFDDWRMVDGVRMPFAEHGTGDAPGDTSDTKYTRIDLDPRLPASLFSAPEKTRAIQFTGRSTSSGWLPFEFFDRTRIFIPATVNGRHIAVMLDSGASANVVDQRFAKRLGLKAGGAMTGQGAGGAATSAFVNGVDLTLGSLSIRNGTAVDVDLAGIERRLGHPLPMILGGAAFTDCVVDIDFRHRRIAFRDPDRFQAPSDATPVALTLVGEIRALGAQVEGRPALLLFDIGNAGALALFPRFWDVPGFPGSRRLSTRQTGGFGGTSVVKLTTLKSLDIGGAHFSGVPTTLEGTRSLAARSGRLDGNLGLPVYSRFHLIVDMPHQRLLFAPPVDMLRPFDIDHSGLTLQNGSSGSEILYVAPGSPGAAAGLKTGDVILTIDGAPAGRAHRGGRRVDDWAYGVPGTRLKVGLASGQTKVLTLGAYF